MDDTWSWSPDDHSYDQDREDDADDTWYPPDDDDDDRVAETLVDSDPHEEEREFPPAP
jgi:hypothetical protein